MICNDGCSARYVYADAPQSWTLRSYERYTFVFRYQPESGCLSITVEDRTQGNALKRSGYRPTVRYQRLQVREVRGNEREGLSDCSLPGPPGRGRAGPRRRRWRKRLGRRGWTGGGGCGLRIVDEIPALPISTQGTLQRVGRAVHLRRGAGGVHPDGGLHPGRRDGRRAHGGRGEGARRLKRARPPPPTVRYDPVHRPPSSSQSPGKCTCTSPTRTRTLLSVFRFAKPRGGGVLPGRGDGKVTGKCDSHRERGGVSGSWGTSPRTIHWLNSYAREYCSVMPELANTYGSIEAQEAARGLAGSGGGGGERS